MVVTADCKGVPLVRSALAAAEAEEAQETPASSSPHHRRGKGEKANKKRMAAVGAVYTIEPFVRTADEVIDEVLRKKAEERRPGPQHKRVRADLLVGKVALFLWLADELCRRNPEGAKPVIFLRDGERALHDRQGEYFPEGVTCILDLFHVMERLWKVAWCLFEEGSEGRSRAVGGGAAADAPGREGGLCHRRAASDADEAEAQGLTPQDGAGGGRLLRSEPGAGCGTTSTWRRATRSAAGWPRGRVGTWSRTGWSGRGCGGTPTVPRRCSTCGRRTSTGSGKRSGATMWSRKTTGSTGSSGDWVRASR